MAVMYPKDISEYMPTDSERIVYHELKEQLPDSFEVFYSVTWSRIKGGKKETSEADFIVMNKDYGYICLEVKGGNGMEVIDNEWYLCDATHGDRKLPCSPYEQAEKSMYFFKDVFSNTYNISYPGVYGAGVVFPFYSVDEIERVSNRSRACTIDCTNINNIHSCIIKMFKHWAGDSYGRRYYSAQQHHSFAECIKKRIAISAAAGALVKYKERQLDVINRVQDSYIYLLSNIRQFYIRGGAGTGKTWIAIKMANQEAFKGLDVLLVCASEKLAAMIKENASIAVDVYCIKDLFALISSSFESLKAPLYEGILDSLNTNYQKYDAIFIDEAQDFTEEWAFVLKAMLKKEHQSRFGVFYDDVQTINGESFSNVFMIDTPPFLLHENIRNTSSIYNWAKERTHLGVDVISNPVEGPKPTKEIIKDKNQLVHRIENILKEYIDDEQLASTSVVILADDKNYFYELIGSQIAKWEFVQDLSKKDYQVLFMSAADFKGLEADMVIYLKSNRATENIDYIAYTRARYYLIELEYRK